MLEIRNIQKSFGSLEVLKGIDLTVEKGDVVAIIGPSGSGKTTLLRCMNFLENAGNGTMVFDRDHFDMGRISKRKLPACEKRRPLCSRITTCSATGRPWKMSLRA